MWGRKGEGITNEREANDEGGFPSKEEDNISLPPLKGGMWGRKGEEIIRELANWEMRKWGGVGYYDDFLVKIK